MRLLLLGPSSDSEFHYGVSYAFNAITQHLEKLNSLKTITLSNLKEESILNSKKEESAINVKTEIPSQQPEERKSFNPYAYMAEISTSNGTFQETSFRNEYTAYIDEYSEILKNNSYDLVYVHDWVHLELALQLKERFDVPFVYHVHSLSYDRSSKIENSFIGALESKGLKKADKIIAVSNYHAAVMVKYYGIDSKKISVVHLATDLHNAKSTADVRLFKNPTLLFSGRLSHQKDPHTLLRVFKKVHDLSSDIRLIIAGDGPLFEELISEATKMDLLAHISFCGKLHHAEMIKLYKQSDILISTSISEPFGLSILEAASFGLPVVCSDNTGALEILSAGIKIEHADIKKFALSIEKLIFNKTYYDKISNQNKYDARGRNWSIVINEIENTLLGI